jgi:hypothetical protein
VIGNRDGQMEAWKKVQIGGHFAKEFSNYISSQKHFGVMPKNSWNREIKRISGFLNNFGRFDPQTRDFSISMYF